jgi:predicted Zn-dependent peptidase
MGSGYYISSGHDIYRTFGHFSIATGTTASRVPEIVSAVIGETKKLLTERVTAVELEKVKELMRSRMRMSLETSDGVADFYAEQEMLDDKIRTPDELDEIFQGIGHEDVARVAAKLFDQKKLTVAVIGKGIDKDAVKAVIAR